MLFFRSKRARGQRPARSRSVPWPARVVLLAAALASIATSDVQWSYPDEETVSLDFLPDGTARWAAHLEVDGHPALLDGSVRVAVHPSALVPAGLMSVELGIEPAIPVDVWPPPSDGGGLEWRTVTFTLRDACPGLPCSIPLVLTASSDATASTLDVWVSAQLDGRRSSEPPPGRFDLVPTEAP